jgi:hypothetical protein
VAFLDIHYRCVLDACKSHSPGLHRPLFHGKLCASFSYNIEGLGKLGKEFGTMLLLTPAVREGDVLCILKS